MGEIVSLRPVKKSRRWRPEVLRARLLRKLRTQGTTRDWKHGPDLDELVYVAKGTTGPRSRSVSWRGIRFPIRHTLLFKQVLCPATGRVPGTAIPVLSAPKPAAKRQRAARGRVAA